MVKEKNTGRGKQKNYFEIDEAILTGTGGMVIVLKKYKRKQKHFYHLHFQLYISTMFEHPKIQMSSRNSNHAAL